MRTRRIERCASQLPYTWALTHQQPSADPPCPQRPAAEFPRCWRVCFADWRLSSREPARLLLFLACRATSPGSYPDAVLLACQQPPEPSGSPGSPQWMHLPSRVCPRRARGHTRGTSRRPLGRLKFSAVSWRAPLQQPPRTGERSAPHSKSGSGAPCAAPLRFHQAIVSQNVRRMTA